MIRVPGSTGERPDYAIEVRLRELEDRAAITDIVNRYGEGVRSRDVDAICECFAEGAVIDHSAGHFIEGLEQIRRYFHDTLLSVDGPPIGDFERTLASTPLMTNVVVEIEGDRAHCESMCLAIHVGVVQGGTTVVMRGTRNVDDLERTESGWRICLRRHPSLWAIEIPGMALGDLTA